MKNPYQNAMNQYKSVDLQTRVESASPHELIDMLLQGARTNIATAQGNIQRNQIREKGHHIGKAITIIDGLRASLDKEKGGNLAENLDELYGYIQIILLKANKNNDENALTEANLLLAEIHEAWSEIGEKKNTVSE